GNLLIFPWNYVDAKTRNHPTFVQLATNLVKETGYFFGNALHTVRYPANGESGDWMYGDTNGKKRIFAFTTEVGSQLDGFWPPSNRISSLSFENYNSNLKVGWMAGGFPVVWK